MSVRWSANLAGTGRLVRLIVRRDRIRLTLWIGGLVSFMAVSAAEVHGLYDTPQAIAAYGATVRGNPALAGLSFIVCGLRDISAGALSWLTPFGWGIGVRASAGERWWTLVVLLAVAVGLAPVAVGLFLDAMVYGSVGDEVEQMLKDNPMLADYLIAVPGSDLTELLIGRAPRLAAASWVVLAVVVVTGIFAEVLRLPRWVRDLSPLEHAPALPVQGWRTLPMVLLTGLAVVGKAGGMIGFRRRDLTGG